MNQKEMLDKCRERGFDVTLPLLYRQGKRFGFLIRNSNNDTRERYDFNEEKFNEWLDKFTVDDNYLPIAETARKNGMSYSALKYRLVKNNSKIEKMGIVHGGLLYAGREDVERAVASYSGRIKK